MAIFEKRNGMVAVSDPTIAAMLCSRSAFWGNTPAERRRGIDGNREMKPFTFSGTERYINAMNGSVRVLFLISGDVGEITARKHLFHGGQLYIDGKQWQTRRAEFMGLIDDARRHAAKKIKGDNE